MGFSLVRCEESGRRERRGLSRGFGERAAPACVCLWRRRRRMKGEGEMGSSRERVRFRIRWALKAG